MTLVVDTNVLAAANGHANQASLACQLACGERLTYIMASETVALDNARLALREYARYASDSGQPGLGDRFLRWLLHGTRVQITDIGVTPAEHRQHIPSLLHDFDENDLKWLALHQASPASPIVNAVDSDYRNRQNDLADAGIAVEELCPNSLKN